MKAREFSKTRIVMSRRLRGTLVAALACIAGALVPLQSPLAHAQTYTVLDSLNGTNGSDPQGSLVLSGSTLYGMTQFSGANGDGTIFSEPVTGGAPTVLYSFSGGADGAVPQGSFILSGSTLYGMAIYGGANNRGNIFSEPTTGGAPTTLASFNGTNGQYPRGSLILSGSTLFGMTSGYPANYGTIFSEPVTGGTPTVLASFNYTNGWRPAGSLILSGPTLYGMTQIGGANGMGNVFSEPVTGGAPTTLYSFDGTNGSYPDGSLILVGSTLYGMTSEGGANNYGVIFSEPATGGTPTVLASFNAGNGAYPNGSLILGGSTLYGMAEQGGAYGYGTIFSEPVAGGPLTTLVSFTGTGGAYPGAYPAGDLTLSGSTLYGMTSGDGANGDGVIFSVALPPAGTTTPEPASWLSFLVFAAIGGLIGRRRMERRKNKVCSLVTL